MGAEKGAKRLTEWLENIYTFLSRLWDYLSFVFEYIQTALAYIFTTADTVLTFSTSFPAEIYLALFASVAACVILFVLGR